MIGEAMIPSARGPEQQKSSQLQTGSRAPVHAIQRPREAHQRSPSLARAREALLGETPPNRATKVGQAARLRRLASAA